MLKKIVDFFKRLNKKEWFRVGIRIFGFLLAADFVYGLIRYIFALFRSGLPFRYLFRFFTPSWGAIALGVAVGLAWYFYRKYKNEKESKKQETAKKSGGSIQDDPSIIETTHYKFF